jgi:hypothetical protein
MKHKRAKYFSVQRTKAGGLEMNVPKPMLRLFYTWMGRIQREHDYNIEVDHVVVAFAMATGPRRTVAYGRVPIEDVYQAVVQQIPAAIEMLKKTRAWLLSPPGGHGRASGDRAGAAAAGPGADPLLLAAPDTGQCPPRPEPHQCVFRRQGDGMLAVFGSAASAQWPPGTRITLVKREGQVAVREAEPAEPGAPVTRVGDTAEVYFSGELLHEIKARFWGSA